MNTIVNPGVQADAAVVPAASPAAARPHKPSPEEVALLAHLEADQQAPPAAIRARNAPDLLRQAAETMEARAREYDKRGGERSVPAVVTAFNAIVGRKALTDAEGWLFMQLLKNVRLFAAPGYHADLATDGITYCSLMAEAKAGEK